MLVVTEPLFALIGGIMDLWLLAQVTLSLYIIPGWVEISIIFLMQMFAVTSTYKVQRVVVAQSVNTKYTFNTLFKQKVFSNLPNNTRKYSVKILHVLHDIILKQPACTM